mgnify:CR=1 FL=1
MLQELATKGSQKGVLPPWFGTAPHKIQSSLVTPEAKPNSLRRSSVTV